MKKIMMHIIMKKQVSGPNKCMFNLMDSSLQKEYIFSELEQKFHAGGKPSIALIRDLGKQINLVKPDIVHISGMQSAGFHAVLAVKLYSEAKIILHVHGFSGNQVKLHPLKRWVFNNIIEPLTFILSDFVILNSKHTLSHDLVQKYVVHKKDHRVIYNYIRKTNVNELEPFNLRDKLNIPHDSFLVLTASRIVYDKGYYDLTQIIERILDKNKNIYFIIAGTGEYEDEFIEANSRYINKNVFMLGHQKSILEIMNESNIFLLPSYHETLSNVAIEASSIGLPCVMSDVGGLKEVIIDKETGCLVEKSNINEFVEVIQNLYDNPEYLKNLSNNAINYMEKRFNNEKIIRQIKEVYENV